MRGVALLKGATGVVECAKLDGDLVDIYQRGRPVKLRGMDVAMIAML